MPLKIYVARDTKGREWAPDTPHEVGACEWMVKKAWEEFHHLQELYAIILNLQQPSADMVVIRERGLGVLELKHVYGEISIDRQGVWMSGPLSIHAGTHLNPREQVHSYACELRQRIIHHILPARLQTSRLHWDELKFQTGICFTNHLARLQHLQKRIEERPPDLEPWEDRFSIFGMDYFTTWIRKLRFELEQNPPKNHEPARLDHRVIERVATDILGQVEWMEIYPAMPTGHPYGYLVLEDGDGRQVFNLIKDHSIIGRSHTCDVVLPDRYGRVSKKHCVIDRSLDGIRVCDHSSRNGTYKKDRRIEKSTPLEHGDILTLGGTGSNEKSCVLRFVLHERESEHTKITEQGTRSMPQSTK